jgi:formylmethanofuran dehydrogenase subunit B
LAVQDVGYPVATLGETKNRADTVLFWGSNPMHAHPRHMSRYSVFARGFFRERGRKDRQMIVVDPRKTDTAKLADIHLQVEPHKDYELVSAMRAALKGFKIEADYVAGIPTETVYEAMDICKNTQFGTLFFSMGITMSRGKHRIIDNAIQLIVDLNAHTKFSLMPMRGHYNVNGFNQVSTWITGYPYGVDFSRGYPRYNPGETASNDLLQRGETDMMLNIASDPGAHFPQKALQHMVKIPLVCIDPHQTPTSELANIVMPTALTGVEVAGTAYRMDGVPIELRKVVDVPEGLLSDAEIIGKLLKEVEKME